jgi:hypothetical protein
MNAESHTPRQAKYAYEPLVHDQVHKRTMFEHIEVIEAYTLQLERELNEAMTALQNLTDEIGRHEGASMMHPRLTRAIAAAKKLTTETK